MVDYKIAELRSVARARATRAGGSVTSAGEGVNGARDGVMERAHWKAIADDFTRWVERRELPAPTRALQAPPGDPFGADWSW